MKEILTNEEIDALLDMFNSEGLPDEDELLAEDQGASVSPISWESSSSGQGLAQAPPKHKRVQKFNLLRPNRFTREQMQYLEKLQEVAALGITSTLTERLRMNGTCDCVLVEQQRFGTFLSSLISPISVYTLEMVPLGHKALLAVSCSLLFSAIDKLMGGTGRIEDPGRELTEMESAVVQGLIEQILQDIAGGFSELVEMELKPLGKPRNLALAQVVGNQEVVLCIHFQVSGDPINGDIRIAIPHTAISSYLEGIEEAGGGAREEKRDFSETLRNCMAPVKMAVSAELGNVTIKLRELVKLRPGDIIVLEKKVGDPVVVPVEGKPKFLGRVGTKGKRYAVRIEGQISQGG